MRRSYGSFRPLPGVDLVLSHSLLLSQTSGILLVDADRCGRRE